MPQKAETTNLESKILPLVEQAEHGWTLPEVEYCGLIAVLHGHDSQRMSFRSGAEGHTHAEVHIIGERMGDGAEARSRVDLQIHGNVLFIARNALIDTRLELTTGKYSSHRIPFDDKDKTQAIMNSLASREVDGVRYDACISFAWSAMGDAHEIVYASADSAEPTSLRIPIPDEPLR